MLNNRFTFPKCGWPFKCGYMRESRAGKHILCKRVAHFLVLGLINSQPSPVPLLTRIPNTMRRRVNLIM